MQDVMLEASRGQPWIINVRGHELQPGTVLGRIATLEVRLASGRQDIETAQKLRYRVFHEELGAAAGLASAADQLDADRYDDACDHLLVIDRGADGTQEKAVGTYRLLRDDVAVATRGFYSSAEFEIERLVARHRDIKFLELGRSCVLPEYRSRRTIELLWQGIWAYVNHYGIGAMTGCASFPGTVPAAHAQALSFLAQNSRATGPWQVNAVPSRYHEMDLTPAEAVDMRAALQEMPPLIKGYLRLGAKVGDGCVIDREFGTTDVFIVLPVASISPRYINYYGADAERFAPRLS
ncbi:GNAT family N-acetyltransferase [Aquamicrobium zhengzhouense]|uniref:L-ornithine N(alpha)-acyltransferase n=1 Tax=Aquamicrobium zhengzhouense TaxID=2781738 RepID=A0ABS0SHE6_9HYPH|nr:GNAT family N-acetyltransferase [Aquamicrobium zhengzhouense]MBI1621872.1 GNAT family N-acetyltransferase [Aquamicrobium zhengzhouense]